MSQTLRILFRTVGPSVKSLSLPNLSNFLNQSTRSLYAPATLGIDGFQEHKQLIKSQMENIEQKFKERMKTYVSDDSKGMIFTEDLKNMAHISENDEDCDLVIKMAKKFHSQNKELRFGNFVFGPVLMRMFYVNCKPELALECFKAPEFEGLFDQLITYQIILDLLYENQKYQDMLDVFEIIKQKQLQNAKYPRNSVVLVMAACYKMNSKESLEHALKLWNDLGAAGHFPMRRATTFCAGLCLNQDKPELALEIISAVQKPNYVTVRNIKAKALAQLGRLEDALAILKTVVTDDQPMGKPQTFNRDILESINEAINKEGNIEVKTEYDRLFKLFQQEGHISEDPFDSILCSEIQKPPILNNRQLNRFSRFNPRVQRQDDRREMPRRPGLKDLV